MSEMSKIENKAKNTKSNTKTRGKSTQKKIKAIGSVKGLVENQTTGELQATEFQVVEVEDRDFNFTKIWIGHIVEALGLLGGAKIKVALWMIEHRDTENNVVATIREIAESCEVSYLSAFRTIQALREADFLKQISKNGGVYKINPNMIFKGSHARRMDVLIRYSEREQQPLPNIDEDMLEIGTQTESVS